MIRHTSFPALCLFILLVTFSKVSLALNPPLSSSTDSQSEIPIFYDDHGLYVQVELADPTYFTFWNATTSVKMMIDLSHSETLLPVNCMSLINYSCQTFNSCENNGTSLQNITLPYFSALAIETKAFVSLNSQLWSLQKHAYLTSSCYAGTTDKSLYGMDRSGIIGLGNQDSSARNFLSSKVFSIYLEQDIVRGGKIYFKVNQNIASDKDSKVTLRANSNWQITDQNGMIQVGTTWYQQYSFRVFFDLNSDVIGLSAGIYDQVLSQLSVYNPAVANYRPIVNRAETKLEDLPNLILYLQNQRVEIPATVYAQRVGDKMYMLNFKRMVPGTAITKELYVTGRFDSSVILNYQFMKFCYTVFDASAGYNQLILHFNTNGKNRDVNMDDTVPDKPGSYRKEMVSAVSFFGTLFFLLFKKCCK